MSAEAEQPFDRPLDGKPVETLPSGLVPARAVLQGDHIRLEPIDPAVHARDLY